MPRAKSRVTTWVLPSSLSTCHCRANQLPVGFGIPSISGICPVSTWIPTPERKPTSTDADRKSPRNPSRSSRASTSIAPQISATNDVMASHCGESGTSFVTEKVASPAARIAAVAESAPTTSSLDDPSSANTIVGKITVYRPVTTGTWAIEV